jgi:hypothetical protein
MGFLPRLLLRTPSPSSQWRERGFADKVLQDGMECTSPGWHIGGDEFTYYCEKICGAQGAEANQS